jgi:hypothetical protein
MVSEEIEWARSVGANGRDAVTFSIFRRYMKFLIVFIYTSYPQGRIGGVMDIKYSQMGAFRSKLGAGMAMTFKTRDTYLLQPVTVEEVYIIYISLFLVV